MAVPAILHVSYENKITTGRTRGKKERGRANDCAGGSSDALWPVHDLRFSGPREARGSSGPGSRQPERKNCTPGAGAFAMPDRGRSDFAAVRLPGAARALAEENRAGIFGDFALPSAGRPRHRADEQAPGL